jgi:hypothetical protein
MIEQWILDKIEPLKAERLILLHDPQRMIQPGARVVDGWAEEQGYTVLLCAGNLALREMVEAIREDNEARLLIVDRSRSDAKLPLFYPDLDAQVPPRRQIRLSLRDFLIEQTGDGRWPQLTNERNLARLLLDNLPGALAAHAQLRQIAPHRFSDSDLYRIALGAALRINPFRPLSVNEIRRLCVEQHQALEALSGLLPEPALETLRQDIARAPQPFCWLLERNPDDIVLAFTLCALMRQHQLDYRLLLSNLDPGLHEYRQIEEVVLDEALRDQLTADPERVLADVQAAEKFLLEEPEARLAFLLRDQLGLDDPEKALELLRHERLSPLLRSLALISLLLDLIQNHKLTLHRLALKLLEEQAQTADWPALRRPTDNWQALVGVYRRALDVYELTNKMTRVIKELRVKQPEELEFATFDGLWNQTGLNRLDYYISDLERSLRLGHMLPLPLAQFWPTLHARWEQARSTFKETVEAVTRVQHVIDRQFQDFYRLHYTTWIYQPDAPVVFTHQFLPRLLQAHWDPQSGRKAVIMVFDGLRTDAWEEFLRPVFEERFTLIESRPGSALLPTETQLSRKAIAAGCLPEAFTSQNELTLLQRWLKQQMGLTLPFQVVRDDDTAASGMTVRYVSPQLEYIVFNFTDKKLHNNNDELALIYGSTVQTIIREDVRSVLRELPDDALLFITSDHGFAPAPAPTLPIPADAVADPYDVKYRNARTVQKWGAADGQQVVEFDIRRLGIPPTSPTLPNTAVHYLLFPRPGYTFKRPRSRHAPDRYTHGGLSLAECLVPMVVMGPMGGERPWLILEKVEQVGSVSENEPLTLAITIAPARIGLEEISLTLSFSHAEIPLRRELFSGQKATYTVQWTPRLGEVSVAEREQGEVIIPVTVIVSYQQEKETVRLSQSVQTRIKFDPGRLRRRIDSKLDLLMGKVPKGLKG